MSTHHHHDQAGKATDILEQEHQVILRMVAVLEAAGEKLEKGEEVPPEVFRGAVDFIRNFADRCHHGKEQDLLFPLLEERGIPGPGGPIGVMRAEHDQGRALVQQIQAATEGWAEGHSEFQAQLIAGARGYAQLLTQHIHKEDQVLYPMGNKVLTETDQQELLREFDKVEEAMGEGAHERYVSLVEELETQLGLGNNPG